MKTHQHLNATLSLGELAAGKPSQRVQRSTRKPEPKCPEAVQCPDGCDALVWAVGDENGRTLLLDTKPLTAGMKGYTVESLYLGPSAEVAAVNEDTLESCSKRFVEIAGEWNWYATYESAFVTSRNLRYAVHAQTCTRKTTQQRAHAMNRQSYGGFCVPRHDRKTVEASTPRLAADARADTDAPLKAGG